MAIYTINPSHVHLACFFESSDNLIVAAIDLFIGTRSSSGSATTEVQALVCFFNYFLGFQKIYQYGERVFRVWYQVYIQIFRYHKKIPSAQVFSYPVLIFFFSFTKLICRKYSVRCYAVFLDSKNYSFRDYSVCSIFVKYSFRISRFW